MTEPEADTDAPVRYEADGDVAVIVLNRPHTLNALSTDTVAALNAALDRAEDGARAILLTGAGRAFSSGADLSEAGAVGPDRDLGARLDSVYNPLIRRLRDLPVPLVTAVPGAAAGVACAVALMGDVIVCARSAYFLQAFANIGLVPDGGSAWLLARSLGRVRAMEAMLLAERLPAETALEAGLVTRVVDDADLQTTAREIAARLAAGPTKALGLIRKSAWEALELSFDDQLARERELQREAGRTEDFVEGVSAFLQKRKPVFKGR